jgi:hypothetical protein
VTKIAIEGMRGEERGERREERGERKEKGSDGQQLSFMTQTMMRGGEKEERKVARAQSSHFLR